MARPTGAPGKRFHYDPASGRFIVAGREIAMPRSRLARIIVGCLLVVGGLFAFLPILGLWMIPVGFLVLSQDIAWVRRKRRAAAVRISRWWRRRTG